MVKAFAANNDVAFGDVNLSEGQVPGNHSPGMGGWPTIRYFNQKTGIEGGNYKKKTSGAMCDELGDDGMMFSYVEEYGNTSLCNVDTKAGCSDKEIGFIEKIEMKGMEYMESQLKRLNNMDPKAMKEDLAEWLGKRKKILQNMIGNAAVKSDEL